MSIQIENLKNRIYYNLSQADMEVSINDDYAAWAIAEGVVHYFTPTEDLDYPVTSINGMTGDVTLSKSDVGLEQVDNVSSSSLRDRSTHTGTQLASTISDLSSTVSQMITGGGNVTINYDSVSGETSIDISGVYTTTNKPNWSDIEFKPETATRWPTYSEVSGTPTLNTTNWSEAYSWGDHALAGYESAANKGVAGGYASLDGNGKIPSSQLPSFVDDVIEHNSFSDFPATGEAGKIYVAIDTNKTYRWGGTTYTVISSGSVESVNGESGVVTLTTSDINESGNLYFTTARAISAIKNDASWNATQWNAAYSWGDHALAGYALESSLSTLATSGQWSDILSKPVTATRWPNWSEVTSKPVLNIVNWDTAYSWGNHALAGYALDANISTVGKSGDYGDLINKPSLNISNWDAAYSWGDHALAGYALASSLAGVATSGNYNDLVNIPNSFTPSAHGHDWGEITNKPATATRWPNWSEVTSKPDVALRASESKDCYIGWHTIATNSGNRCSAKFVIYEKDSGSHQSVHFYAAHHYGNGNTLTVHSNSSYSSGGAFRYIRLKEAGTYDGVMLQVYVDRDAVSGCTVVMYENDQESGWTLQDWLTTEPYVGMSEAVRIELDKTMAINTTAPIYENNKRIFSPDNKPSWTDILSKPTLNIGNWDVAYSWGDHALAGYALASSLAGVATSGQWSDILSKPETATRWPTPEEIGALPADADLTNVANSDKLDNLDSTQFVRSDVDDDVNGVLSHNANVVMKENKTMYGGTSEANAKAAVSYNPATATIDFEFMD